MLISAERSSIFTIPSNQTKRGSPKSVHQYLTGWKRDVKPSKEVSGDFEQQKVLRKLDEIVGKDKSQSILFYIYRLIYHNKGFMWSRRWQKLGWRTRWISVVWKQILPSSEIELPCPLLQKLHILAETYSYITHIIFVIYPKIALQNISCLFFKKIYIKKWTSGSQRSIKRNGGAHVAETRMW